MSKMIVSLGKQYIFADTIKEIPYDSDQSLLDGDIILVAPDLSSYSSYDARSPFADDTFRGLKCLNDDSSFNLKRHTAHWRTEITEALRSGKTVIVWLLNIPCVAIATGETQYSGTGRNSRTTRIVQEFDPYEVLPTNVGRIVRKGGERIQTVGNLGALATYWHEFGNRATFEAYIENFKGRTLLQTQTGNMAVGGSIELQNITGKLFLLPPPEIDHPIELVVSAITAKASKAAKTEDARARQTEKAQKKAESIVVSQLISSIIAMDKAVRAESEATPPPSWTEDTTWRLAKEQPINEAVERNLAEQSELETARKELLKELAQAQELRALLYENGRRLESAILIALRLIGYTADGLKEEDSEFDAVMISPSGERLIGEAEGKDDRAISVEKLDQLDRNLREDFLRQPEEGAKYALGVLFGNAYRFTDPLKREEFFTQKCQIAAQRSRISLVRTTDLFAVAQYLQGSNDPVFATLCRAAIANRAGQIVIFPPLPDAAS
jgi:hypothetical protein